MFKKTESMLRYKGFLMVLIAAVLWGLSGTVAQHLFHNAGFQHGWLVMVRLVISGVLLLSVISFSSAQESVWRVWKSSDRWQLVIFGLAGMLGVQYTYFAAIEAGNAATATLLQYLGPVLLTCYIALRLLRMPSGLELAAVSLSLLGTFFLVTGGNPGSLTISQKALFWGLLSAACLAFYTLYPTRLLKRWGAAVTVGWGMVIGGVGLGLIVPPWQVDGQQWNWESFLFVLFVILFGTLVPFYLYLASLSYIRPGETALLASAEPLTAAVAAVLWLDVPFGPFEWIGSICIMGTVVVLSRQKEQKEGNVTVTADSMEEAKSRG